MYQLIYEKKEILKQNNSLISLYTCLDSCSARFQIGFDDSLGLGPSIGTAKILQCCAIGKLSFQTVTFPIVRFCFSTTFQMKNIIL